MSTLRLAESAGRRIVEVFDDEGVFVAAIYPTKVGLNAIHIVSGNFAEKAIGESPGEIGVPGYLVSFKKRRE